MPETPGNNAALLARAGFESAAATPAQYTADRGREVAFAGRSNAGKSSAINVLTGQRSLARVSKTPGRTQQINFFGIAADKRLVDLPGYGYSKAPARIHARWMANIETYLASRRSLVGVVLVVDARRPLTDLDRLFLDWCLQAGRPVHLLLSKCDKLSRSRALLACRQAERYLRSAQAGARQRTSANLFSAKSGEGLDRARAVVADWLQGRSPRSAKKNPGFESGGRE